MTECTAELKAISIYSSSDQRRLAGTNPAGILFCGSVLTSPIGLLKGTRGLFSFFKSGKADESAESLANKALNKVKLMQKEFSSTSPNAAEALNRKL